MVVSEIQQSGNICPQSGIWYEIESGQLATVASGERFPLLNKQIAKWKLKSRAKPVPLSKEQLKKYPWNEMNLTS